MKDVETTFFPYSCRIFESGAIKPYFEFVCTFVNSGWPGILEAIALQKSNNAAPFFLGNFLCRV